MRACLHIQAGTCIAKVFSSCRGRTYTSLEGSHCSSWAYSDMRRLHSYLRECWKRCMCCMDGWSRVVEPTFHFVRSNSTYIWTTVRSHCVAETILREVLVTPICCACAQHTICEESPPGDPKRPVSIDSSVNGQHRRENVGGSRE